MSSLCQAIVRRARWRDCHEFAPILGIEFDAYIACCANHQAEFRHLSRGFSNAPLVFLPFGDHRWDLELSAREYSSTVSDGSAAVLGIAPRSRHHLPQAVLNPEPILVAVFILQGALWVGIESGIVLRTPRDRLRQ